MLGFGYTPGAKPRTRTLAELAGHNSDSLNPMSGTSA
jgi:hypothetical protein